jgi:hypothetical protein
MQASRVATCIHTIALMVLQCHLATVTVQSLAASFHPPTHPPTFGYSSPLLLITRVPSCCTIVGYRQANHYGRHQGYTGASHAAETQPRYLAQVVLGLPLLVQWWCRVRRLEAAQGAGGLQEAHSTHKVKGGDLLRVPGVPVPGGQRGRACAGSGIPGTASCKSALPGSMKQRTIV